MGKIDLVPLKRVGPFVFRSQLNDYLELGLIEVPEDYIKEVDWKVFTINNKDIRLYFEDGLLVAVLCDDECYYNDINLIGLDFDNFKSILNAEPNECNEEDLDDGITYVYDFYNLELVVYVKNGKVVSISCG